MVFDFIKSGFCHIAGIIQVTGGACEMLKSKVFIARRFIKINFS